MGLKKLYKKARSVVVKSEIKRLKGHIKNTLNTTEGLAKGVLHGSPKDIYSVLKAAPEGQLDVLDQRYRDLKPIWARDKGPAEAAAVEAPVEKVDYEEEYRKKAAKNFFISTGIMGQSNYNPVLQPTTK